MNTADVTTPPPPLPRGADPSHIMTRQEVMNLVDDRIRQYDAERRREDRETNRDKLKQKVMTYGIGGVAGLAVGAGSVLLVQRLRRGKSSGVMKP